MSQPRRLKDTLPIVRADEDTGVLLGGQKGPYDVTFKSTPPTKPGEIVRLQMAEPRAPRYEGDEDFTGWYLIVMVHDLDADGWSHGTRLKADRDG